jgi:hypothetical protein
MEFMVNGRRFHARFDSGDAGGVYLKPDMFQKLGIEMFPRAAKNTYRAHHVPLTLLGSSNITVSALVFNGGPYLDNNIIPAWLFRDYAVTLYSDHAIFVLQAGKYIAKDVYTNVL